MQFPDQFIISNKKFESEIEVLTVEEINNAHVDNPVVIYTSTMEYERDDDIEKHYIGTIQSYEVKYVTRDVFDKLKDVTYYALDQYPCLYGTSYVSFERYMFEDNFAVVNDIVARTYFRTLGI